MIYDGPGKVKYYPDSVRVDLLRRLVDDGFGKQIILSNDMGKKSHHQAMAMVGWALLSRSSFRVCWTKASPRETVDDFHDQ